MKLPQRSLRLRLIVILLLPLLIIAIAAVYWRYNDAVRTGEQLFDRTLLALTLVVSRHVVSSGGDLLAEEVLEVVTKYLGDQVFYTVIGPKNSFVTGYSNGPEPPEGQKAKPGEPLFFNGEYQGDPVRATVYKELVADGDIRGWVTVKVWQTTRERAAFARRQALQSLLSMLALLVAAAAIIWFGVNRGLKPLLDLTGAVTRRSADDLSPIQRDVPREVRGLVASLNDLFNQLRKAFAARDVLIGDAAHQLRNPIAAILSQAEIAAKTSDADEAKKRVANVAEAARRASRLTQQLLSMDKARGRGARSTFDLSLVVSEVARNHAPEAMRLGANFEFEPSEAPLHISGDETMIRETVDNLIDNAVRYGTRDGGNIVVSADEQPDGLAVVTVEDNGPGIPSSHRVKIFERFVRLDDTTGDGCGLGLAIASEVAAAHDGKLVLADGGTTRFVLSLPTCPGPSTA